MSCKHSNSNIYCAQCDRDLIDWYEKSPAYAIKTHEAIAREAGFNVSCTNPNKDWFWHDYESAGLYEYGTQEEAWKACCVENNLLEG